MKGKGICHVKHLLTALDSLLITDDDHKINTSGTHNNTNKTKFELDQYNLGYVTKKDILAVKAYQMECSRICVNNNKKADGSKKDSSAIYTTNNSADNNNGNHDNNNGENLETVATKKAGNSVFNILTSQSNYCGLLSELVRLLGILLHSTNDSDGEMIKML